MSKVAGRVNKVSMHVHCCAFCGCRQPTVVSMLAKCVLTFTRPLSLTMRDIQGIMGLLLVSCLAKPKAYLPFLGVAVAVPMRTMLPASKI